MKSLEIVNRNIKAIKKLLYKLKDVQEGTKEDFEKYYHEQELKDFKIIKQDLEVLEIILDNCENKFLDILHECLIRGTPIHTEDIQRLSGYINKIITIKKQCLEENGSE